MKAKTVSVKLFGESVKVHFAEDSNEILEGYTTAQLREAAKQYILDTIYSVGEVESSALVRVIRGDEDL